MASQKTAEKSTRKPVPSPHKRHVAAPPQGRKLRGPPSLEVDAVRAGTIAATLTEGSSETGSPQGSAFTPRPSHWAYLRAKIECLESGQSPTTVNLAKWLRISRIAVWKLRRRWPLLDPWCDEVLRSANAHEWGAVEKRMADLAKQGSAEHAKVFVLMRSAIGGIPGNELAFPSASGQPVVNVNLLIPRPAEYAKAFNERYENAPAALPAGIPTVAVRQS